MPLLAARQVSRGGPVAAVQLDNEVGMLSWVSNTPELTDQMLSEFAAWSTGRWGTSGVRRRYGMDPDDLPAWRVGVRSPVPGSLALHHETLSFPAIAANAIYPRNAALVVAAVELKYSGGSTKPRSSNARLLVSARR